MKTVIGALCLLAACVLMPVGFLALAGPEVTSPAEVVDNESLRVGEIHICGNIVTKDRAIMEVLGLYPNQVLRADAVVRAEAALFRRFRWRLGGSWPSVEVSTEGLGGRYRDIIIRFPELQTPPWIIALIDEGPLGVARELVAEQ